MEGYWTLARRAAEQGVRNVAPDGSALVRWGLTQGPEIWAHLNRDGDVAGAMPFFSTGASHRIAVTGTGEDPDADMEGWIDGWLDPAEEDEPYSGRFPLRVDVVNYGLIRNQLVTFPAIHRLEVIALPHEADLFPDERSYRQAPGEVYRVPVGSFVSSAHFGADADVETVSESTAMLSGPIAAAHLLTNPETSAPFWRIQVDVQHVTLHVFADRDTLGGEPSAGQILAGSFWMLGRLL